MDNSDQTFQVHDGSRELVIFRQKEAMEGIKVMAEALRQTDAWQNAEPYMARATALDVYHNLGEAPRALVIAPSQRVTSLSQKLDAALQLTGALRRTPPAAFNASVLNSPGDCVIIANEAGQEQLAQCQHILDTYEKQQPATGKSAIASASRG